MSTERLGLRHLEVPGALRPGEAMNGNLGRYSGVSVFLTHTIHGADLSAMVVARSVTALEMSTHNTFPT